MREHRYIKSWQVIDKIGRITHVDTIQACSKFNYYENILTKDKNKKLDQVIDFHPIDW